MRVITITIALFLFAALLMGSDGGQASRVLRKGGDGGERKDNDRSDQEGHDDADVKATKGMLRAISTVSEKHPDMGNALKAMAKAIKRLQKQVKRLNDENEGISRDGPDPEGSEIGLSITAGGSDQDQDQDPDQDPDQDQSQDQDQDQDQDPGTDVSDAGMSNVRIDLDNAEK